MRKKWMVIGWFYSLVYLLVTPWKVVYKISNYTHVFWKRIIHLSKDLKSYLFFLFFFEKPDHKPGTLLKKQTETLWTSKFTNSAMSKGKASIQMWQPAMEEAFFARASTTLLPERFTWLKLTEEKLGNRSRTSSTIFPKEDSLEVPWETAEIIVAESPSNITRWRAANWTALRQARASISATIDDSIASTDRTLIANPARWHQVQLSSCVWRGQQRSSL